MSKNEKNVTAVANAAGAAEKKQEPRMFPLPEILPTSKMFDLEAAKAEVNNWAADLTPVGKFNKLMSTLHVSPEDVTPLHLIACAKRLGMKKPVPVSALESYFKSEIKADAYIELFRKAYLAICVYNREQTEENATTAKSHIKEMYRQLTGTGIKPREGDLEKLCGILEAAKRDRDRGEFGREIIGLDNFRFEIELNIGMWLNGEATNYGKAYLKASKSEERAAKKEQAKVVVEAGKDTNGDGAKQSEKPAA